MIQVAGGGNLIAFKAGLCGTDARHILGQDVQRRGGPAVVDRARIIVELLPQGVIFVVEHGVVPLQHPLKRQVGPAHDAQGLEHILLRERAGLIGAHDDLGDELVIALLRQAGQRQHGVGPLVDITALWAPETRLRIIGIVIGRLHGIHPLCKELHALRDAQFLRQLAGDIHGVVVNSGLEQLPVDALAPVVPRPGSVPVDWQAVLHLKELKVVQKRLAVSGHGFRVSGVEPVVVGAGHKDQTLVRNLLGFDAGRTAGDGPALRGPRHAGQDRLFGQVQPRLIIAVKGGVDLIGRVSHVGAPLPFRAVHVGIPHADGDGVESLLPQLVQVVVGRGERAGPRAVEPTPPVAQAGEGHTCLCLDDELAAAAPGVVFIVPLPLSRDIGILKVRKSLPVCIGVSVKRHLFPRRGLQGKAGGELDVSRQVQHQDRVLVQGLAHIIGGVGKVLYLTEGGRCDHSGVQAAEGQIPGF